MSAASFAEKLKELRKEVGLNQTELAEELGASRASISAYENGDRVPDIEFLEATALYFDVSCDWLLGISDIETADLDVNMICKYTGLSEQAVYNLSKASMTRDGDHIRLEGLSHLFSYSKHLISSFDQNLYEVFTAPNGLEVDDADELFLETMEEQREKEGMSLVDSLRELGAEVISPGERFAYWKRITLDMISNYIDRIREELLESEEG